MSTDLKLDNWTFKIFKLDDKEDIVKSLSDPVLLQSIRKEMKPFYTPGTLQSNIASLTDLNPYFEDNMKKLEYLEEYYLLLHAEFPLSDLDRDYCLWVDYIDTMAQIFFNGVEIRNTSSAHIQYKFHLPTDLIQSVNTVSLIISPPMSFVDKEIDLPEVEYKDRVFIRKPTYNYGWDFAPRSLLVGIGESKVLIENSVEFSDLFVETTKLSDKFAELSFSVTLNSEIEGPLDFILEISQVNNPTTIFQDTFPVELKLGMNSLKKNVKIENYNLWWPNGTGKQSLYELRLFESTKKFKINERFGIRTVNLILEEEGENSFIFEVNGKKIFARGANWVPTDSLTNFGDEWRYRKLLSLAKNGNFNMIRIWGGGVVEDDRFYDICDEFGIMIWHDFQFACSVYPEHDKFLSVVETEISSIIRRLRNHPSIVLWCGNNENEWIDYQSLLPQIRLENKFGDKLHQMKKHLCSQLDPSRPYWRSSPWSPSSDNNHEFDPNSMDEGNNHDWCVWHGVGQPNLEPPEYDAYAENHAKFITEFGIQSFPSRSTINQIFSRQTQVKPNTIWEFHNLILPKIKINMKKMGEPTNIDEWILYTQAAQAFGMKFAIETWRARKFNTAGALIWQFNEPWPTICWSLIDYYGIPKMAYWFVKRSFNPVIIVKVPNENTFVVISDLLHSVNGELKVKNLNLEGDILWENTYEISIESNSKTKIDLGELKLEKSDLLWVKFTNDNVKVEDIIFMSDPRDIRFPTPKIDANLNGNSLTLLSSKLALLVHLPNELEPNDNYFHLIPNISKEITLKEIPKDHEIKIKIWNNPFMEISLNNNLE